MTTCGLAKARFCRPCEVLGSAGAQAAASGAQLERSSAAQHRRAKKQGGWSVGNWNLATVLCWELLHLLKLPWYFNNRKWFNRPSGRQQHWYSWVRATHIIAYNFLARQFSFRIKGRTYFVPPFIPACSHSLSGLSFCVPWLQMYCGSSLQYSLFVAWDQGRSREKASHHICRTQRSPFLPFCCIRRSAQVEPVASTSIRQEQLFCSTFCAQ